MPQTRAVGEESPRASPHGAGGIHPSIADLATPLGEVTRHPRNARTHDLPAIRESLRTNGQYRPIVVNRRDRLILAGNGTHEAAEAEGWAAVAVTWVDVDDDAALRILLVDNRANDLAGYDDQALVALLEALPDLGGTGYDAAALAELQALVDQAADGVAGAADPDDVPEVPVEPVTQPGDVWRLGPHRLLCGDCRSLEDVQGLLAGARVQVAFTSPPYASQRTYDPTSGFQPIKPDDYVDWFAEVQAGVRTVLAEGGSWFVNIKEHSEDGQRHLYVKDLTIAHVRRWGWMLVDELCWVDTRNGVPGRWPNRFKDAWEPVFHYTLQPGITFNPLAVGEWSSDAFDYHPDRSSASTGSGFLGNERPGGAREGLAWPSNVLHIAAAVVPGAGHSAPFPVDLPAWFLKAYSDPGDKVLDPFCGSGSTLIAAHRERRVGYGVEISPGYVDVACRRFQQITGIVPILDATGEPHDFTASAGPAGVPAGERAVVGADA